MSKKGEQQVFCWTICFIVFKEPDISMTVACVHVLEFIYNSQSLLFLGLGHITANIICF